MNKPRSHKRSALLALGLLLIGLGLSCVVWVRKEQRQYALNRQLIAALLKDDTSQAREIINAGADPNTPCKSSPAPSLKQLLQQFLHPQSSSLPDSPTALMIACAARAESWYDGTEIGVVKEDLPLIRAMLAHGANVNTRTSYDDTVLACTARFDSAAIVKLLLENGAKVNEPAFVGRTALVEAAMGWQKKAIGQKETVSILLARGAKVNAQDEFGSTALHMALEHVTNINIIQQLLAHGADPRIVDEDGESPITLAQQQHRPDLIALLHKYSKRP